MFNFVNKLGLKETLVWLIVVVTLGVGIYSNTWHSPFVLDDIHSIIQNEARRSVSWYWADFLGMRTILYFTLDLNYAWNELEVGGYHAVNISLHILNSILVTMLVFLVSRQSYPFWLWQFDWLRIDTSWLLAISSGLLFLVHPIQTQGVNYIVQRMVLLTTLFYLSTLVAYCFYRSVKKKSLAILWAIGSIGSCILAMHSKEIAFTLPVAVVLIEYAFFSKTWRKLIRRWWKLLPWVITILIIPAYFLEVRSVFIQNPELPAGGYEESIREKINLGKIGSVSAETQDISRRTYFVTQWKVMAKYIRLIVWPIGLNIDHDVAWEEGAIQLKTLLALLLVLSLVGGAGWLLWRQQRVGAVGIILFFLALSVESSVIPIKDNIFEHRLYLPMVGVALVATQGLAWVVVKSRIGERSGDIRKVVLLVGVVIMVLSGLSYARNNVWVSALALWSDAAEKSPQKARPLNNLGLAWEEQRQWEKAEENYRQGLEYNPDNVELMVNLGALLGKTKRTNEAIEVLKNAAQIDPNLVSSYINLGNVYTLRKNYLMAEESYRQALEIDVNNAGAWASLGDALIAQGRESEAIDAFEQAVAIKNDDAGWYNRLGALYAMAEELSKAEVAFNQALTINPQLKVARDNLKQLKRDQAKTN